MINTKDVIRMKVPYPSISDTLAVKSHMYICKGEDGSDYEFVKCQTLKPYMLMRSIMCHYVDEAADLTRNSFERETRIDCDKLFSLTGVRYDDGLKTTRRPDICQALYDRIIAELEADGYNEIEINEDELLAINSLITKV